MKRALGQVLEDDIGTWVRENYMTKKKAPAKRPNRADLTLRNLKPLHDRLAYLELVCDVIVNGDPYIEKRVKSRLEQVETAANVTKDEK